MNKAIKFRAWDNHNKTWLDTSLFNIRLDDGCLRRNGSIGRVGGVEVVRFTGLKDKNGTEIYESDIIHDQSFDMGIGAVIWDREYGGWVVAFKSEKEPLVEYDTISEIIGNVYEDK